MTRREGRGRLQIVLDAAPGVGKTFAMLAEGHRRAERGTDAVGLVQTHGRVGTAEMLGDLDALLAAGIDAITTVNVQHLGSLDDVESITGNRVRTTLLAATLSHRARARAPVRRLDG